MGITPDFKGQCDRCEWIGANPSLAFFLVVSDLNPDNGEVATSFYCRDMGNNCAAVIQAAMATKPDTPAAPADTTTTDGTTTDTTTTDTTTTDTTPTTGGTSA